jgi:hypothetical protein
LKNTDVSDVRTASIIIALMIERIYETPVCFSQSTRRYVAMVV